MAPLVLLHAIGLDEHLWDLCRGMDDALKVDLPGHGDQPMLNDVSLRAVADHVAHRLPPSCDIVGLSLGGMVAQYVALGRPDRVRSLVLICTRPTAKREEMLRRARRTEEAGMDGFIEEALPRWFTPATLARPGHPGVSYVRRRLHADDPAVMAAYWRSMADHDLAGELHRVHQPVTVVAGQEDTTSSVEAADAFAGLFPRGKLDVRPGSHMIALEQPSETVRSVHDHLAWVTGGSER